jgi:hypothetical protein
MKSAGWRSSAVSHLDHQITNASHRMQRAVLRAERAGILARMGKSPEALAEISFLRTEFKGCLYPEVSVRLYLAEAWQAYFADFSPKAGSTIRRAHALSQAAGLTAERALSAAWLAHMDYIQLDFHAMVKHILEALHGSEPHAHNTRSRACLVVAEAYHLAGAFQCAQPWYAQARFHAMAGRDPLTLSAINHNMAWHRTLQSFQQSLWGNLGTAQDEARHAMTSAAATQALDTCGGTMAPQRSIQLAQALGYSVLGRYDQALNLYDSHGLPSEAEGLSPLKPLILADMAWCCYQIGQPLQANHYALESVLSFGLTSHADNLALAHARLDQVFQLLDEPHRANTHRHEAESNLRAHQQLQAQLLHALNTAFVGF